MNIFDIENKFKNELEALNEWSFLRIIYDKKLSETSFGIKSKKISFLKELKNSVYGFVNWFGSYDVFVFSDTLERRIINGKQYDKTVDFIISVFGEKKCLYIDNPCPSHFNKNEIATEKIVSIRMIDLLAKIVYMVTNRFIKKNNIKILNHINQDYAGDLNYDKVIKRFSSYYYIYYLLFKIYRPSKIFINCYYSNQAISKAANDLNIEIYEVQHGIINHKNIKYSSQIILNKTYFPKYLLTYDYYSKASIEDKIYKRENIFVVGNFYLHHLIKNFQRNIELDLLIKNYNLSIGISLQWTCENEVITFVNKIASNYKDILFLLIPREINNKYDQHSLCENVVFYNKIDCHNIILHCDYHMSAYSACIMEANILGIKNILLNINNYANYYYDYLIDENNILIDNAMMFGDIIKAKSSIDPEPISIIDYETSIRNHFIK